MKTRTSPNMMWTKNKFMTMTLIIMMIATTLTYVHADIADDKEKALLNLSGLIQEKAVFESEGFYTRRIDDGIAHAQTLINSTRYLESEETISEAMSVMILAREVKINTTYLENRLPVFINAGMNVTLARNNIWEAKNEIMLENYEGASRLADESRESLYLMAEQGFLGIPESIAKIESMESYLGNESNIHDSLNNEFLRLLDELLIEDIPLLEEKITSYLEALQDIKEIDLMIAEVESDNRKINIFSDLKNAAIKSLEAGDLGDYEKIYSNFITQKEAYHETKRYILLIEADSAGIGEATEFSAKVRLINDTLSVGNYQSSLDLAKKAYSSIEAAKSKQALATALDEKSIFQKIKDDYMKIMIITLILVALGILVSTPIMRVLYKRRSEALKRKIIALDSMIKDTQRKYFKDRKISRSTYDALIDKYQEKMVNAKESSFITEKKLESYDNENSKRIKTGVR